MSQINLLSRTLDMAFDAIERKVVSTSECHQCKVPVPDHQITMVECWVPRGTVEVEMCLPCAEAYFNDEDPSADLKFEVARDLGEL